MEHSNSYSELKLAAMLGCALALLTSAQAEALNVHAVYRTACLREMGVILKVEKRNVRLLTLDGRIVEIPRHEIVSLAYYPVSQLPLARLPRRPAVPALRIETLLREEIVPLATGWPVDYSETKIAFLLDNGKDIVIDKDSIWSLELAETLSPQTRAQTAPRVEFAHPQTAGFCAEARRQAAATPAQQALPPARPHGETGASASGAATPNLETTRVVFAQQLLNDRVVIKRELDRLQEGYEEVVEFAQDQKFYPVPHVYRDKTALGLWVSALSRYGGSNRRTNNYTPMLVDELHMGPFSYQHIFLSGAAPNQALLHNEAQVQIYYRLKAAYFHASVFADPNLVLVGNKYGWRRQDFQNEVLDDRMNEVIAVEFGFDYGPLAIELTPAVAAQAAVKLPNLFDSNADLNLWRAGVRFRQRTWEAQLFGGFARSRSMFSQDERALAWDGKATWRYSYARGNLSFRPQTRIGAIVSTVYRRLDYEAERSRGGRLEYDATSISTAVQAWYGLSHRFNVGGNAILEVQRRRATGISQKRTRAFPKLALFTSFSF